MEAGSESTTLLEELRGKLDGLVDPASGRVGITGVFPCDMTYAGPYVDNAPDLLIGYGEGFRASWDSVMGKVTQTIFEDNLKAWSGDHCIDPRLVPGVLFANRRIDAPQSRHRRCRADAVKTLRPRTAGSSGWKGVECHDLAEQWNRAAQSRLFRGCPGRALR